ncbi:MAG: PP2C family serine/threonine-protein phosphatase [Desulfuromonadales bacterium]
MMQGVEQMGTTFSIASNGRVNMDFRGKIEGKSANGNPVVIQDVIMDPELRLSFDSVTAELHGTPKNAGEFDLTVTYRLEPPQAGIPGLTGVCRLIVNPDPKTLWKNLESDQSDVFWKENQATAALVGGDGFSMIAASKRGRSHAHVGSFRDDDFCLVQDEASGWRIITVADGAGSAKKSRRGSQIAARIATEKVLQTLKAEGGETLGASIAEFENNRADITKELYYLFGYAAQEAVLAIENEAKTTGALFKDFSTTLIVMIHKKIDAGHFIAAYWVGDGGVGVYRQGREVKILGRADSGEFAGQTRFLDAAMLDSQEIMNRIKVTVVPDFTAIVAMTDGITDPWFETDANLENCDKWEELWKELLPVTESAKPDSELLEWLDFWSPGNHDDRTIAILYPVSVVSGTTEKPEMAQ